MNSKTKRIVNEEVDSKEQERLLKSLRSESEAIAQRQTDFIQKQQILDYSHRRRMAALQYEEEQHALRRKEESERIAKQRLDSIASLQSTMHEFLKQQHQMKQLTVRDLDDSLHHHRKMRKMENERARHSAALNELEADSRCKLNDMERDQMAKALELKVERLRQQFIQSQSLKQQAWEHTLSAKKSGS